MFTPARKGVTSGGRKLCKSEYDVWRELCHQVFPAIAAAAVGLDWANDPFDRVIVAQALCDPRSRLATADETIRAYFERAVW